MEQAMASADADFRQFFKVREAAGQSFVNGNAEPIAQMIAARMPVTFFGPSGTVNQDAASVAELFRKQAAPFERGDSAFETLHAHVDHTCAYWVGIQKTRVTTRNASGPTDMDLRVTELFRREDGAWKLVHRHADLVGPRTYGPAGSKETR
jgi:ketosteroid isomerase-like protein